MKNNILSSCLLILCLVLVSTSVQAQRNTTPDPNVFLNRDYWEKQPSISTIEASIREGNSITQANGGGFDATTFAIFAKNPISTIQFLLDQGNDINKRTHDSRTYVFWAASSGNLDLVKHLIKKGAKLNLVDSHGYGPISFTAATGQHNTAIYDAFLASGADLNEKDHQGKNALLVAVGRAKDIKIVDYFIGKGLDINSTDNHGNGIFHYAAQGGNIGLLNELIDRGVSTKKNEETGENAIFYASKGGRGTSNGIEVFKYLEGLGINANVTTKEGKTPLHNLASSTKDNQIFDYFIAKGVDPNAIDAEGNTALLKAAVRNNLETVRYFTEKSNNINLANKEGLTALTLAVQNNSAAVVSYLISNGADVSVIDKKGNNLAAYLFNGRGKPRDFDTKLITLKSKGLDLKELQGDNSSLWHLAVSKNDLSLLKKISDYGADINSKDNNGNTPLHYAAMKTENDNILKYLIKKGADPKSTTDFGETAYDLAKENELLTKNNVNIKFLNQ